MPETKEKLTAHTTWSSILTLTMVMTAKAESEAASLVDDATLDAAEFV